MGDALSARNKNQAGRNKTQAGRNKLKAGRNDFQIRRNKIQIQKSFVFNGLRGNGPFFALFLVSPAGRRTGMSGAGPGVREDIARILIFAKILF